MLSLHFFTNLKGENNMLLIRLITALVFCFSMQAFAAENTDTINQEAAHVVAEHQVNLNTATVEQLENIKGVGPAKAKAIVEYRTAHGPFKSVDGLAEVKGLSPKVVEKLLKRNAGVMVVE
jgi:comEA protein